MSEFESLPVVQPFARSAAEPAAPRPVTHYSLKVDTGSSLAEAFVIDGSFNMLARGQGKLDLRLPAGEYLVKYRTGDKYAEQWITRQGKEIAVCVSQTKVKRGRADVNTGEIATLLNIEELPRDKTRAVEAYEKSNVEFKERLRG